MSFKYQWFYIFIGTRNWLGTHKHDNKEYNGHSFIRCWSKIPVCQIYSHLLRSAFSKSRLRVKNKLEPYVSSRSAETHLVSFTDWKWQISCSQLSAFSESVNVFFPCGVLPPLLYFQNVGISQKWKEWAQNKGPFQSTRDVITKGSRLMFSDAVSHPASEYALHKRQEWTVIENLFNSIKQWETERNGQEI